MSLHVEKHYDPLHPILLHDHLDRLHVHDSPPPTLTARFAQQQSDAMSAGKGRTGLSVDMFKEPSSGSVEEVSKREDDRRTPPDLELDPRGTLETFIQHLLSPSHGDSDPHLIAIGYELEALLAIYPSLKLVMSSGTTSRPASMAGSVGAFGAGSGAGAGSASRSSSKPRSNRNSLIHAPDGTVHLLEISSDDEQAQQTEQAEPKRTSQLWTDAVFDSSIWTPGERIRYEVSIPLWEEGEVLPGLEKVKNGGKGEKGVVGMPKGPAPLMRVLVSLPPTYPDRMAPQLQLLGRYLGDFGIDAGLFGDITRTYISSSGSPFTPGDVCVFEGLTYALGVAQEWYAARLSEGVEGEKARDEERRRGREGRAMGESYPTSPSRGSFGDTTYGSLTVDEGRDAGEGGGRASGEIPRRPTPRPTFSYSRPSPDDTAADDKDGAASTATSHISRSGKPAHINASYANGHATPPSVTSAQETGHFPHFTIHISQPIVDRKSTFIGHAIKVTDEREVPLVIHEILSDKKVAKAAHPAMFAYRVVRDVGGVAGRVVAADCDDDGETAAGSRLAHLLDILELENVLVVVSRWYGGVHLGSDRFKHINQAARDALEVGGFLTKDKEGKDAGGKGRRK